MAKKNTSPQFVQYGNLDFTYRAEGDVSPCMQRAQKHVLRSLPTH